MSFYEAIRVIDRVDKDGNPFPFDIVFRTLNRNSKTGGRLVEYKKVVKSTSTKKVTTKHSLLTAIQQSANTNKNPNHFTNRTRNLMLQNGDIKKIHIRLIVSINGLIIQY